MTSSQDASGIPGQEAKALSGSMLSCAEAYIVARKHGWRKALTVTAEVPNMAKVCGTSFLLCGGSNNVA